MYLNEGDWADYFYSNFSKAEDGPVRTLKLGVEEEAAIQILTGDCLHHCSVLVSEASLQEHGLSDLGLEGNLLLPLVIWALLIHLSHSNKIFFDFAFAAQERLNTIFAKREKAAAKVEPTQVQRVKRPRKSGAEEVVERIRAFLAPRPKTVDEDPSPYVVQWGLLNKDTVVGDARAAAEWSKNVVTPRDRAHVVESSEDLQIEMLGPQAVASVRPISLSMLYFYLEIFPSFCLT